MPHVLVNGVRFHVEEHGSGEPILCIHGTGSSALAWERAIPALAELGRVIAYDRRGCHRSERPHPYATTTVAEHTDDARALLAELDAEPAIVIGRSYGGSVALDLALRYPGSVRAVVLLEAVPAGLSADADSWNDALTAHVNRIAGEQGVDAVGEGLAREVLGMWQELPAQWRRLFTANGAAILAELRGGRLVVDAETLRELRAPTLVVSGADSAAAFGLVSEALAAAIPHARRARVEGGHLVDPADPSVRAFLSELLATP